MNVHNEKLIHQFEVNLGTLNELSRFTLSYLKDLICKENKIFIAGIEGRVKTIESLKGKLELKGQKYNTITDITDLFGARIITFYNDEIDRIAALIEKNFVIDFDNSIDKRKLYDVDRFGYMSLHYICKIPKKLYNDEKFPFLNDIRFEIQIRTTLQHTWATIFHDTGYKSNIEVPKEYIRRLSRLAGLLEIADDEFRHIRDEINDYRGKIGSLVSKGNFKDISLNIDSYRDYLKLDPYRSLIKKIAAINHADVEDVNYERYYDDLVAIGFKSLSEVEQMRIENSDDAYKLSLLQLSGTDIDIISSTIAMQNLITIYLIKNGASKETFAKLIARSYGNKNMVSDAYLDRLIEQAKGIVNI